MADYPILYLKDSVTGDCEESGIIDDLTSLKIPARNVVVTGNVTATNLIGTVPFNPASMGISEQTTMQDAIDEILWQFPRLDSYSADLHSVYIWDYGSNNTGSVLTQFTRPHISVSIGSATRVVFDSHDAGDMYIMATTLLNSFVDFTQPIDIYVDIDTEDLGTPVLDCFTVTSDITSTYDDVTHNGTPVDVPSNLHTKGLIIDTIPGGTFNANTRSLSSFLKITPNGPDYASWSVPNIYMEVQQIYYKF
jgi:hypothetical protein